MSDAHITIDSPDGPPIEFENAEAFALFLDDQMPQFQWLLKADVDLHNHLYGLIGNVQTYAATPKAQNYCDRAFVSHRFPISGSPFAQYIDDIRREDSSLAGLILGIVTLARSPDYSQWQHLRALSALVAFQQKLTPKSVEASQASFRNSVEAFQRQEKAARGRGTKFENKLGELESRSERLLSIAKRYVSHKIALQRSRDDARVKASLDEMEATKALYMEHMALKAPVEYWKKKALAHGTQGATLRSILLKYAFFGGGTLILLLVVLAAGSILAISAGVPGGVLIVLATIGVVLTTIAFWAGRILTRLYLSEVHLGIDASERATMVETYLALTSVGEASKDDRAIILASLFRPTADGIVKDDAAPELSPAGIISRVLTPG